MKSNFIPTLFVMRLKWLSQGKPPAPRNCTGNITDSTSFARARWMCTDMNPGWWEGAGQVQSTAEPTPKVCSHSQCTWGRELLRTALPQFQGTAEERRLSARGGGFRSSPLTAALVQDHFTTPGSPGRQGQTDQPGVSLWRGREKTTQRKPRRQGEGKGNILSFSVDQWLSNLQSQTSYTAFFSFSSSLWNIPT